MAKSIVIPVDGPVAAGKTVVGRLLAQRLGYQFLDTGIMYRTVTWLALNNHIRLEDGTALSNLVKDIIFSIDSTEYKSTLLVNKKDISEKLRQPQIEQQVSLVSSSIEVRTGLVLQQREIAKKTSIVMVGRDIGTVVFPNAKMKIFLMASVTERAKRRYNELKEQNKQITYLQVLNDLKRRDRLDSERVHSPLKIAGDSHIIDTDGISAEQSVQKILELRGI